MKTLAITGGTGGLGTEVVRRLSRDYRCMLLTRKANGPNQIEADLTSEESVQRAFAELDAKVGAIYGLVHMAGGWAGGKVADTSLAQWRAMFSLNLDGAFLAARESLRRMERPGRIIMVSSIATMNVAGGAAAYTAAKAGINVLVQSLAEEHRIEGITANALLPDGLATPAMRAQGGDRKLVPLERVAATIEVLLAPAAAAITGTLIPIHP